MSLADKIRPHVHDIVRAEQRGDKKAAQVISLYQMHVACPADPAAPALCEAAFNDWLATTKEPAP